MSDLNEAFFVVLLILLAGFFAWLPGGIAYRRRHVNAGIICAIGWLAILFQPLFFIALVWAFTNNTHRDRD